MPTNINQKFYSRPVTIYKMLTTTAKTNIGTIPLNFNGNVTMVHFANLGTGSINVDFEVFSPILNDTIRLFCGTSISSGGFLTLADFSLYLCPGDIFKVTSSSANDLAVTISYDAIFDPNGTH